MKKGGTSCKNRTLFLMNQGQSIELLMNFCSKTMMKLLKMINLEEEIKLVRTINLQEIQIMTQWISTRENKMTQLEELV